MRLSRLGFSFELALASWSVGLRLSNLASGLVGMWADAHGKHQQRPQSIVHRSKVYDIRKLLCFSCSAGGLWVRAYFHTGWIEGWMAS